MLDTVREASVMKFISWECTAAHIRCDVAPDTCRRFNLLAKPLGLLGLPSTLDGPVARQHRPHPRGKAANESLREYPARTSRPRRPDHAEPAGGTQRPQRSVDARCR